MSDIVKRYNQLKKQLERTQAKRERAQGRLDSLMNNLKEEHGCEDLKEARRLAKQLKRDADQQREEFEQAMFEFEEKWGDKLQDAD